MTPKEKAIELVNKYKFYVDYEDAILDYEQCILNNAKQCALIAVKEILQHIKNSYIDRNILIGATLYWQEVKQEIEKL